MRRPDLAGRAYRRPSGALRGWSSTAPNALTFEATGHDAAPGETDVDLDARGRAPRSGEAGRHDLDRQRRAPRATSSSPPVRCRLRVVDPARRRPRHRRRRRPGLTARARPTGGRARQRDRTGSRRSRRRDVHGHRRRRDRVAGLNRYVDGGDGGDTYNYSPPRGRHRVDRPESVERDGHRVRPAAGPGRGARQLPLPTARRSATNGLHGPFVGRRARRHRPRHHSTSCHRRSGSCGCTSARPPLPRPPTAGPLPTAHPGVGSDAGCAFAVVHRGLTAEGGPHEFAAADVPVPPLRRLLRRQRRPGR